MPKEEKHVDLKTGRVRRKAIFGDEEDEPGDSDDEEMCEGDKLKNSSSDEETEEERDAEVSDKVYVTGRGVKRQRLEEVEEDAEVDLPAFADSDDDLEKSSEGDGEAEEADESSEEEESSVEGERHALEAKAVEGGGKAGLLQSNGVSGSLNVEKTMKQATVTISDSGHCTAEEAFASEDESEESSSLSTEEEDSENEEVVRKKFRKPFAAVSGQKLGSENVIDEISDVEDLLKEEEDYTEENNFSIGTSGMLQFNSTDINSALKMFYK